MKNILYLLVVVICLLMFASCSEASNTEYTITDFDSISQVQIEIEQSTDTSAEGSTPNDETGDATFLVKDKKYTLNENDILLLDITNETEQNYISLVKELVNDKIDVNLRAVLDARLAEIRASENYADYIGKQITIHIDASGIAARAMSEFNMTREELTSYGYEELLAKVADSYKAEGYNVIVYIDGADAGVIHDLTHIYFGVGQILEADGTYKSAHDYITDSSATDKTYDYTDFTCDNGNVVMVKYTNAATGEEEIFFLNYNMFAVDIAVDNKIDKSLADGERVIYRVTAQGFLKLSDAKAND